MWVQRGPDTDALANVLASHSLNAAALGAHKRLYETVMFEESPLSRSEREAIAVAVSAANECHYWVVHHSEALVRESGDPSLPEAVASGHVDRLHERMAALCVYALKLTLRPDEMEQSDIQALRAVGVDDRGIVDANQVVAYFNYVNRVADGLGVELEAHWPEEVRNERRYGLRER